MMDIFPILGTRRLQLRRFEADDLTWVYKGLSHPEVVRYYGVHFQTLDATKTQLDWFAQLESEKEGLWWAVCLLDTSVFCGAVGFNDWDHVHRKAEIGFWLLPEYWGRGIMMEAGEAACAYAFDQMRLHRIEAFVQTGNTSSVKVLTRLGFSSEGTLRDCEVKNDRFISLQVFSKLSTDSV